MEKLKLVILLIYGIRESKLHALSLSLSKLHVKYHSIFTLLYSCNIESYYHQSLNGSTYVYVSVSLHTVPIHSPLVWYSVCPHISVFFSPGSTQRLPCHTASGDNCTSSICPNTVVTYACTIPNGPGGLTDWTLSTGTCPSNTFPDTIRLSQYSSQQCSPQGASMCGPNTASSILPSFDITYCLSSILTVNITTAMNGSTVTCSNTNIGTGASTVVSSAIITVSGMSSFVNPFHLHNEIAHIKHKYQHVMLFIIINRLAANRDGAM